MPQDIFILNSSLKKNIALGEEENKIDDERVIESLKFANLYDFTKSLPNFINTEIKHRGVNLSGGQIQRIGIARAFYHEPEVIILDESTNSLDDNTEQVLLNEIHKLKSKKTFIIVSHKVSTISICDKVYSFKKGGFFEWIFKKF